MTKLDCLVHDYEVLNTPRTSLHQRPTVLVVGGAGYVGSALLPKLLEAGFKVRILDLLLFGPEPISAYLDHPSLELVQADFRHVDQVAKAMKGVDSVIHLGGIVGDPACALNEELTIEVNITATQEIAEVAKKLNIQRFIFASSCSVYGASDLVLNEQSELSPLSLYAKSKIECEAILKSMASDDFSPIILRFATIYGQSGRTRFDLVVNLLTAKAFDGGEITLYGGDQWRPFVHVEDIADALLLALKAPLEVVHNQVFNVGSNTQNYTLRQAAEVIQSLVPGSRAVENGYDGDWRNYRVDFSKIESVLSFVPKWKLEAGIQQVLAALQSGKVADYQDAKYSNVKFFKEGRSIHSFVCLGKWPGGPHVPTKHLSVEAGFQGDHAGTSSVAS